MLIGLLQYDIKWEDKEFNKNKIEKLLSDYKGKPYDWIVFPELSLSGFSMNPGKTSLNEDDFDFFKSIAKSKKSYISFGGVSNLNNCMYTLSPSGQLVSQYSKQHMFSYAKENLSYKAGESSESFDIMDFRVLPAICYDLRFTYLFWENAQFVDLFFVAANWPSSREDHWRTLLKARAIENQAYVLGVNRVGSDEKLKYNGNSLLFSPMGEELINAKTKEGLFTAEVSKNLVLSTRQAFPFLKDRKK